MLILFSFLIWGASPINPKYREAFVFRCIIDCMKEIGNFQFPEKLTTVFLVIFRIAELLGFSFTYVSQDIPKLIVHTTSSLNVYYYIVS